MDSDGADNWVSLKEQAEALYNALVENGLSDDEEVQALWAQISALTEQPELDAEALAAIEAFKNAANIFLDAYEADPYDMETWYPLKEQAEALYKVLVEKDLYNYEGVQELWALVNSKAVMDDVKYVGNIEELVNTINADDFAGGTVKLRPSGETFTINSTMELRSGQTYTIDLNGNTLDGGYTEESEQGTQILNITAGNVTLTNGTLTHGYTDNTGGAVSASNGASLTIGESCIITENYAKNYGGGVYATGTDTKVTIESGKISNNRATWGGGIYICNNADLTVSDGEISGNAVDCYNNSNSPLGGGICAYQGGVILIKDGVISANTADNPSNNKGTGKRILEAAGGGVSIGGCISFSMTGGTISNNIARNSGGGIRFDDNNMTPKGVYTISGGKITENQTTTNYQYGGGGIYVNTKTTLTLENALVTGNTSGDSKYGVGLSGCQTSQVRMFLTSGGAVFGNTDSSSYEVSVAYSGLAYASSYYAYFSPVMLGGGYYNWWSKDGLLNTHDELQKPIYVGNDPSEADQGKAQEENATKGGVVISGNYSLGGGGGIGTNGSVNFGTAYGKPYIVKAQSLNGGTPTTSDLTAQADDTVTYYLTVANETGSEVSGLTITDVVPEGMTLDKASINGTDNTDWEYDEETRTITWLNLSVAAMNTETISFQVRVDVAGAYENTASLSNDVVSNTVYIKPPTPDTPTDPTKPSNPDNNDDDDDDDTIDITETTVPLSDIPETEVPLTDIADMDVPLADIPDEDIPLTDIPRTGDESLAYILAMMLSGMGLAWLAISEKRKRDSRTE